MELVEFLNSNFFKIIGLIGTLISLILSIIGLIELIKRLSNTYKRRHLRYLKKIFKGIKDGDDVTVICSELPQDIRRYYDDDREIYYHCKYGDIDAYFEIVLTLLKLFPKIKITIMSSGEAEALGMHSRGCLQQHLILIGGPDYNKTAEKILEGQLTQFNYKRPETKSASKNNPNEIVLHHKYQDSEYCHQVSEKDFGYFEKIKHPHNSGKILILLGGCHSLGVTAIAKTFSLLNNDYDYISPTVRGNAKRVVDILCKQKKFYGIFPQSEFCILVEAEGSEREISTPEVKPDNIWLKNI